MRKYHAIIPIVLAIAITGSGSIFLYKWLKTHTTPKEVVAGETEVALVSVAAVDLPWGTKLKQEMLKTVPFLKESLPPGYFSDPSALDGRVVIAQLKENEPVTESRLAPNSVTTGGVSAIVTPGKRAIAVKGDKVIGLSGFINPGNRVDVLVTLTDPRTKMEVTKLVLEKIPVLATGTEIKENKKGDPAPVDVYTLEVTPEEGEKLTLASTKGRLQFALRNIIDTDSVLTKGANIPQTLSSLSGAGSKTKPAPSSTKKEWRPRTRTFTVEMIKGNEVSKKKFES